MIWADHVIGVCQTNICAATSHASSTCSSTKRYTNLRFDVSSNKHCTQSNDCARCDRRTERNETEKKNERKIKIKNWVFAKTEKQTQNSMGNHTWFESNRWFDGGSGGRWWLWWWVSKRIRTQTTHGWHGGSDKTRRKQNRKYISRGTHYFSFLLVYHTWVEEVEWDSGNTIICGFRMYFL